PPADCKPAAHVVGHQSVSGARRMRALALACALAMTGFGVRSSGFGVRGFGARSSECGVRGSGSGSNCEPGYGSRGTWSRGELLSNREPGTWHLEPGEPQYAEPQNPKPQNRELQNPAPRTPNPELRSPAADSPTPTPDLVRIGVATSSGAYTVVSMPIDAYVARVLAGEAARNSPPAALEALAITVRTFAAANRGRHRADGFDLCDQTHCQV